MPGVKISGITNTDDAKWAAILGVEFISVSLVEGDPRKVSSEKAVEIASMLPSYTAFILELAGPDAISGRKLEKISPSYLEFPAGADSVGSPDKGFSGVNRIIRLSSGPGEMFYQLRLSGPPTPEELELLKESYEPEQLIIEGDLSLDEIKKICGDIQVEAWSVRDAIAKSPRRIDYSIMKYPDSKMTKTAKDNYHDQVRENTFGNNIHTLSEYVVD